MEVEGHLYVITHTDLDGVGSAAAALVSYGRSPGEATIIYAEPYNIHERLSDIIDYVEKGDIIVIADLGPNKESFPHAVQALTTAASKGARIYWYDHHVWDPGEAEAAEKAGVTLVVDRSTCATGVVGRYAPRHAGRDPPAFLAELERAVCAADLWRWDHPLAPKLFRVADARGEDREAWRNRLVAKFAEGVLWDEELEEKLEEYVNLELANYNRVLETVYVAEGACRVAAAYKGRGPPSNSFIGASLQARYNADVAVIVRDNGALSLRSSRVNVQRIAALLGGGGHPAAAGARIRLPVLTRIAAKLSKKMLARHAARVVLKAAEEAGVCRGPRA